MSSFQLVWNGTQLRTCKIRSPSLMRPSFAAILFGSTCREEHGNEVRHEIIVYSSLPSTVENGRIWLPLWVTILRQIFWYCVWLWGLGLFTVSHVISRTFWGVAWMKFLLRNWTFYEFILFSACVKSTIYCISFFPEWYLVTLNHKMKETE